MKTMTRRRTYGMAMAATAGAVLVATPSSAVTAPTQVPTADNAEYDVQNYDLAFAYNRTAGAVDATTTMTATATSPLRSFTIDFARTPTAVTANGAPATVTEDGDQTVITLGKTLPAGETLTLVVTYAVTPSLSDNEAAFPRLTAPDGEIDAAGAGIPLWLFPHASRPDAATFDLRSTLPALLEARRTDNGMRYLDASQLEQLKAAAARARAAREAAARQAAAEVAAARADAVVARRASAQSAAADQAERRAQWRARWADARADWNNRSERDRWGGWDRGDRSRGEGRGHGRGHHGDR